MRFGVPSLDGEKVTAVFLILLVMDREYFEKENTRGIAVSSQGSQSSQSPSSHMMYV